MSNTPVARPYQFSAVQATINALNTGHKAPCVVIGTGGGKTIVIALQVAYILKRWPKARILLLSHVVELIAQDSNALHAFGISHGVFSASLGRKETLADYQVIVAQIQSVHRSKEFFDCDFALIDECFVAGTKVLTPMGEKDIDQLRCGDTVYNASGIGTVEKVSIKPAIDTYRLEFDDGSIIECTENHPFFTQEQAWCPAGKLEVGTSFFSPKDLSLLWQRVLSLGEIPSNAGENNFNARRSQLEQEKVLLHILLQENGKSDEQSSSQAQSKGKASRNKAQTYQAWRERAIAALSTASAIACPGRGMGIGISNSDEDRSQEKSAKVPNLLQVGSSQSTKENWNRSGWGDSCFFDEKRTRSEKDEIFNRPRLVNISRIKRESAIPVFNLQVSGHPSYFANGKLVHNCHLINYEMGMYTSFINNARQFTKDNVRLIGYTATPYRLKDGSIIGANKLLDFEAFNISTEQLQDQGYLKRFTLNLHAEAQVDLTSVGTVAGDYNQGQLSDLMSAHSLVAKHAAFVARVAKKRQTWLAFCVDIEHAQAFADALRALNIPTQAIHSKLDNAKREQFLVDFKEGRIRCLVSVATLTTGFDTRLESGEKMVEIDCLISLRPTKSRTLWDQIKGRGTRPVYADGMPIDTVDERIAAIAASTHPNCLLISFCGNPLRFDFAKPKDPTSGKGNGEAPTKTCPKCGNLIHAALRKCNGWIEQDGVECDQEFDIERTNHEKALHFDAPKKGYYPRKLAVRAIYYEKHNKLGKPPMLRVTYQTDGSPTDVSEYILLEHKHSDYAYRKAHAWWAQRCRIPVQTVEEALQYTKNLPRPSHIIVDKDGEWFRIKDFIFQKPE